MESNKKVSYDRSMENTYNYGLALLKIIMSFEVVLCHYWGRYGEYTVLTGNYLLLFSWLRNLAVPVFLIISFYYLHSLAKKKDIGMYKKD